MAKIYIFQNSFFININFDIYQIVVLTYLMTAAVCV